MNEDILNGINSIRNDKDGGSSEIARKALATFAEGVGENPESAAEIKSALLAARPSMAAIGNVIEKAYEIFTENPGISVDKLKNRVSDLIDGASKISLESAAETIVGKFGADFSAASCSFSGAILNFAEKVSREGAKPKFNVLESNFSGKKYGRNLAEKLNDLGIESELFGDSQSDKVVEKSDFVIIGADKILPTGATNGFPSLNLAESARGRIPVYVVAESYKLTDNAGTEPGLDFIPGDFVDEIFMDSIFGEGK